MKDMFSCVRIWVNLDGSREDMLKEPEEHARGFNYFNLKTLDSRRLLNA